MALIIQRKLLLLMVFTASSLCYGAVHSTNEGSLSPTRDQSITGIEVVNQLSKRHYLDIRLNDELSSRFFDQYLRNLDANRSIFLKQDIHEFEQYRFHLDDTLKRGNLNPGYHIFNRYRERLSARLETAVKTLPQQIDAFDFSKDEQIKLDRKDSPWPNSSTEAEDLWRKNIKNSVLNLRIAGKETEKIKELLSKRYKNQLSRIKQLNNEDVFQLYINSLTQLYDPHTSYLSPRSSENFNINMSLKLEGIGAVLQREDDYTKVARLVHEGPADKSGQLQPADRIIGVGQGKTGAIEDVIGWRLDEVVQLIRGKKNTTVRLEVIPVDAKSDVNTKIIRIVRDEVKLEEQSAKKEIIEVLDDKNQLHKVGIIDVPAFYIDFEALRRRDPNYKSTTRDVHRLLNELMKEGVSGIIIDLRDNGGGSLKEANELTGLFIDYGPTVQIRHASERIFREQKLSSTPYYDGPLLVLINRLSASASEIFAGAMQDYQRAIIVGGQSFGKGTVQSLSPLRQGQLKLTESKFYRISGDSTQHRGVVPDISFPRLYNVEKVGESALDDALEWDKINSVRHRKYFDIPNVLAGLQKNHMKRADIDPDFQFLKDQIQFRKENGNKDFVSLNESIRKNKSAHTKQQALTLENKRRKAKGLDLLASIEDLNKDDTDETKTDKEHQKNKDDDDDDDIYLSEAGHILVDAIKLFRREMASNR